MTNFKYLAAIVSDQMKDPNRRFCQGLHNYCSSDKAEANMERQLHISWIKGETDVLLCHIRIFIQSTLVILKLKGPSETLRDICTSTYQIFRNEENTNRTTEFHK